MIFYVSTCVHDTLKRVLSFQPLKYSILNLSSLDAIFLLRAYPSYTEIFRSFSETVRHANSLI